MKTTRLCAIEICDERGKGNPEVIYRSDLYPSKKKAKKAFLDLETGELFGALDCLQCNEDPPVSFEENYATDFHIAEAYDNDITDVTEWVLRLAEWIRSGVSPVWDVRNGNRESFLDLGISFGYKEFNAHIKHGKKKKK